MKRKNNTGGRNRPNTTLYLNSEIFNSFISVLSFFIATENKYGTTFFSKHSEKLREKIFKHCRIFKKNGDDNVAIHFFGNESAIMLKLLVYYLSLGEEPTADYFSELKKYRNQM